MIACFPVYRSYITGDEVTEADRRQVLRAMRRACWRNPGMSMSIFHFIRDTLLCAASRARRTTTISG